MTSSSDPVCAQPLPCCGRSVAAISVHPGRPRALRPRPSSPPRLGAGCSPGPRPRPERTAAASPITIIGFRPALPRSSPHAGKRMSRSATVNRPHLCPARSWKKSSPPAERRMWLGSQRRSGRMLMIARSAAGFQAFQPPKELDHSPLREAGVHKWPMPNRRGRLLRIYAAHEETLAPHQDRPTRVLHRWRLARHRRGRGLHDAHNRSGTGLGALPQPPDCRARSFGVGGAGSTPLCGEADAQATARRMSSRSPERHAPSDLDRSSGPLRRIQKGRRARVLPCDRAPVSADRFGGRQQPEEPPWRPLSACFKQRSGRVKRMLRPVRASRRRG